MRCRFGTTVGAHQFDLAENQRIGIDGSAELAHRQHNTALEFHGLDGFVGGGAEPGEVDNDIEFIVFGFTNRLSSMTAPRLGLLQTSSLISAT